MHATVGDRIIIETEVLGQTPRQGTVLEVLGGPEAEHYRVTWDDGHESLLYPGPDTHLILPAQEARAEERQAPPGMHIGPRDRVEQIMSTPVLTVDAQDSLRTTAETLADADVGALVVMRETTPLGVISERDVVRALAAGGDPDEVWAADVIGTSTVWANTTDTVHHVATLMSEASIRHVPLRTEGALVGIVSVRDVLSILLRR
ncbi:DUF1918 domain-containing protein [Actinopolymorpha alba]|uniref:DUF1918 domain-containing protein n=1 Tax=Actinopolymorpha alba TaxID=533267 RepID=UPI0012F6C854|nr:DUF1918 domain-containing protein [Actinopolymorpha alba]